MKPIANINQSTEGVDYTLVLYSAHIITLLIIN
jgi:hypothetical protein